MIRLSDPAATRWIFLLQPLILGAWFPRIPQVQTALSLGEAQLAFALMGLPVGLLLALFFGGRIAEALGTRRLLVAAFVVQAVLMPSPVFAWSGGSLFAGLVVAGVSLALAELGLNVTASEVETRAGRHIMNGCHGFWSIGLLIGSAIGSVQAEMALDPRVSLLAIAAVSVLPAIWAALQISDFAVPKPQASDRAPLSRPLVLIALFAFGIAMTEGAMADWSAIFFTQSFDASPGVAGASFTMFALFVALGRFCGDPLKARFVVVGLARAFAGLALVGLAGALLSPTLFGAFAGIALLGLGVSLGFPLAVSAVSVLPGRSSAGNVAVLTQVTLCGFLLGPPMIGLLAEVSNLRVGLAALAPFLGLSFVLAGWLRPADP